MTLLVLLSAYNILLGNRHFPSKAFQLNHFKIWVIIIKLILCEEEVCICVPEGDELLGVKVVFVLVEGEPVSTLNHENISIRISRNLIPLTIIQAPSLDKV